MARKKGTSSWVFGPSAPHKNLGFPANANITAAEILAFCPYWLKSPDVVYRLVGNGMTAKIAAIMINHFRDLPDGPTTANSMYTMMKLTMRNGGHGQNWTINGHTGLMQGQTWQGGRIDVGNFKVECVVFPKRNGSSQGIRSIPFKDMIVSIVNMPQGEDALDLTRCVEYAHAHPEQEWVFPRDYNELLMVVGGPRMVRESNWDWYVFDRWSRVPGYHKKPYTKKPKKVKTQIEQENGQGKENIDPHGETMRDEAMTDADADGETDEEYYDTWFYNDDMSVLDVNIPAVDNFQPLHRIYPNTFFSGNTTNTVAEPGSPNDLMPFPVSINSMDFAQSMAIEQPKTPNHSPFGYDNGSSLSSAVSMFTPSHFRKY